VNKQDAAFVSLLVILVLWFTQGMIWDNKVPFFRDLGPYFYPMRFGLAGAFHKGELPLWDRHMSMGFPLLADFQSGSFYPPHLLFLVWPFFTAIRILYVLHYMVAALGAYRLCRHWGYPPYLALIGGELFALGGTLVSLSNVLNHFQTAVWLPWVVLWWEKTRLLSDQKSFVYLALLLVVQFLAGSPELYLMTLALLLLDTWRIDNGPRRIKLRRTLLLLGSLNVVVMALSMAQILPTVELLLESRGSYRVDYSESAMWSLQPWSLINLFFLDKEVDPKIINGVNPLFLQKIPFLISHYLGPFSMLGILLWLCCASRKEKVLLSLSVVISVIVSMGDNTPGYALVYRYLPFGDLFRFPEKFFFLTYALVIVITLRGLHAFLDQTPLSLTAARVALLLALAFWLGLYCYSRFESVVLARFVAFTSHENLFSPSTAQKTSAALLNLERQAVLVTGFSLLLILGSKRKLSPGLLHVLIPGLLFVDLSSANEPHHHLLAPRFVSHGPKIIKTPNPDPHRLFYYPAHSHLHPSFYVLVKEPPPSFAEVHAILFANLLPNTGVFYGFDFMQEIDALRRWPYLKFLSFADRQSPEKIYKLLSTLNVEYIISFQPLPEKGIHLVRHFPDFPSWLYQLDALTPRAYIVAQTTAETDPSKILERLASDEFDGRREVILERNLNLSSGGEFPSWAKILDYTDQRVILAASASRSGVLVLADSYYPGWRVYVDGEERQILRANLFFRAVELPAGNHQVEFRYEPLSFTIGRLVSLLSLSSLGVWILYRRLRQRKDAA
jgi:hypothetical protein